MRIYATYSGTKDIRPEFEKEGKGGKIQLHWTGVRDCSGNLIEDRYSNPSKTFKGIKKGSRYAIDFKDVDGNRILYPTGKKRIGKNLLCKIIRRLDGDDYIFIKGKYSGKKVSNILTNDPQGLNNYLIWLGENTYNEATIINILNILEIINYEQ